MLSEPLFTSKDQPSQIRQIADELEMLDTMLNALAEIMEEKGQLRYSEWEGRIKKKITKKSNQ